MKSIQASQAYVSFRSPRHERTHIMQLLITITCTIGRAGADRRAGADHNILVEQSPHTIIS